MLCLKCRFVSPPGSVFCGRCAAGFGRVCPSLHINPGWCRCCLTCGNKDLSETVPHIPVSGASRLLAWGLALVTLWLAVTHLTGLASLMFGTADWSLRHLFGSSLCVVVDALRRTASWLLVIYAGSFVLPGAAGAKLRHWLPRAVWWTVRALAWAASALFRAIARIVDGPMADRNGHGR